MNAQVRPSTIDLANARPLDMKLEIAVIPVSDVDRAKQFYSNLGWRLDADFANGDDFRVIQFTPPGSATSVIFGKNVTPAAAGSAQGLYLVVSDMDAARKHLLDRGIAVSEAFHHEVCGGGKLEGVTVTGTVGEKDGKKTITPTAVTVPKKQ